MNNAIVKLGFCFLFLCTVTSAFAANPVPTVTRVGASPQRSATGEVSFTVTFDVNVTDFDDLTDVTLSGAGAAGASVTSITPVTAKVYTVLVGGLTVTGNVKLVVPAGVTNSNDASTGEQTIDFDGNPAPVITHPGQSDPTTGSRDIFFTVDFGELIDASTLDESDFSFSGSDVTFGAISFVAGSKQVITPDQVFKFKLTISGLPTVNKHIIVTLPANKVKDTYGNDNNASSGGDNDVTWAGALPKVTLPQDAIPQTVNAGSLDIYGNAVDGGGLSVTQTGTIWSYSTPVGTDLPDNADDHAANEGSGIGPFNTVRDNALDAHKLIYYVAYADNSLGRALSEERSIWTLDDYPTADGHINSAMASSGTTMDLDFTPKGATADGLVILMTTGGSPVSASAILQGQKPENQPGFVAKITDNSGTYQVTGLSGGTQYTFVVIPYNVYNSQDETTNYRNTGFNSKTKTTLAASSKIVQNAAPANTLAYASKPSATINSTSDGLVVADLALIDGNGPADDPDDDDTELATLKISITNPGMIGHVGLYNGTSIIDEGTLTAGEITFTINANEIKAADDDNTGKPFQIIANFTTAVTDGAFIKVKIEAATVTAGSSGLVNSTAGSFETPAGKNLIAVIATKFVITNLLPNPIRPSQDFGFTATLVDDNNITDTNIGGNVTLSLNAADGTLTPSSPSAAVSSAGVVNFSNLQLSDADVGRRVTLHATGSPGPPDQVLLIDVVSVGANVSNNSLSVCFNSTASPASTTFTTLAPIVITEGNKTDFKTGNNQTYSIQLPDGFVFNKNVTPTVLPTQGTGISASSFSGYNTAGTIARWQYSVANTTSSGNDQLTVTGLMVKYIGITAVGPLAIIRIGGTAQVTGISEDDPSPKPHGTLSSQSSATVQVTFKINAPGFNDTETNFSKKTTIGIVLEGVDAVTSASKTGVFSGDGVSLDGDGKYKFYPNSVPGGNHPITFSHVADASTGCISTGTRIFSVYESVIDGLATKYCEYDPDFFLGAPTNLPTGTCLLGGPKYTFNTYNFGYNYPGEGTATAFHFSLGNQIGNTIFSPASWAGISAVYDTYLGYSVINNCPILGLEANELFFWDQVALNLKPAAVVSGLPFSLKNCDSDVAFTVTPQQFNNSSTYDRIWTSIPTNDPAVADNSASNVPGISGTFVAGFKFTPSDALDSNDPSNVVQVNYKHEDPNTGCQNRSTTLVTVYKKPGKVTTGQITNNSINGFSVEVCEGTNPANFKGDLISNPTILYNWYDEPAGPRPIATNTNDFKVNSFIPQVGGTTAAVGVYNFNVTQTLYNDGFSFAGCESDKQKITVTVTEKTIIDQISDVTICQQNDVALTGVGGVNAHINSPDGDNTLGGTWTSLSGTPGTFNDGTGTFPAALTYTPTTDEWNSKNFTLLLTTNDPAGSCQAVSAKVTVSVNQGTVITFPSATGPGLDQIHQCAADAIPVETKVENASGFHWEKKVGFALGDMDPGTITKLTAAYVPAISEKNLGGTVVLKVIGDDPDGSGPCPETTKELTVFIDQRPLVNAGPDLNVCVDQIVNLVGTIDDPLSSASTGTWTVIGADKVVDDPSALVTTYTPSTPGPSYPNPENPGPVDIAASKTLIFTLTSDLPGGSNVCLQQTDEMIVTLHAVPKAPLATSPDPYCAGAVIKPLTASGTNIIWYRGAAHTQFGTGPEISTGESADIEKVVPFYATQTFNQISLPNGTITFAGCKSAETPLAIVVNPLPLPAFSFANQCLGDTMEFTDESTVPTPIPANPQQSRSITNWTWSFDDGTTTDASQNPLHTFDDVGQYSVRLALRTSDGCEASYTRTPPIEVGSVPNPQFTVAKLCDEDDTKFTATSGLPSGEEATATYSWDFGDGATISGTTAAEKQPTHQFPGVNSYPVALKIVTDLGCTDQITKTTSILPYVKTFPYIENFESPNHGWVAEGQVFDGSTSTDETSWNLLTSAGTITADPGNAAGPHFWATHTNAVGGDRFYFDNERSVLYGPCVDMTALSRPVVALDYLSDIELQGDGAYMEYKVEDANGNGSWQRLGDNVAGLEWYKGASIGGLSLLGTVGQALSQYGWTGATDGWRTGRFNLDDHADDTRIRFRIVFGSNSSPVNTDVYDGFALDYFKLESRNRLVLVENFTSASTANAVAGNTTAFKTFPSSASSAEVVKIEYHTGLPAQVGDPQDPIFAQNPMDPNARASFYGLSAVPRGYIDGYSNLDGAGMFGNANGVISTWAANYYSTESLKTSPIEININTPTITNGVLNITGSVVATEADLLANRYSLYIAVVEKNVANDAFVLRKMLPSASGIKVPATAKGGSFTFDQSWSVDKSSLGSNPELVAVAFVQSDIVNTDNERPVLQAAYNDNVPVVNYTTGVELPFLEQTAVYPNPADRIATIDLPEPTKTGVEVNVIDQLGRAVLKSAIGVGQRSTSINTSDLSGAVYIVQLKENGVFTTRRLLVTHSNR